MRTHLLTSPQLDEILKQLDDEGVTYHFTAGSRNDDGSMDMHLVAEHPDADSLDLILQLTPYGGYMVWATRENLQPPQPSELKPFTVWCRESNNTGTTWIDNVDATDVEDAKVKAVEKCAQDWQQDSDGITCIGVAEGDVKILDWDDIE